MFFQHEAIASGRVKADTIERLRKLDCPTVFNAVHQLYVWPWGCGGAQQRPQRVPRSARCAQLATLLSAESVAGALPSRALCSTPKDNADQDQWSNSFVLDPNTQCKQPAAAPLQPNPNPPRRKKLQAARFPFGAARLGAHTAWLSLHVLWCVCWLPLDTNKDVKCMHRPLGEDSAVVGFAVTTEVSDRALRSSLLVPTSARLRVVCYWRAGANATASKL